MIRRNTKGTRERERKIKRSEASAQQKKKSLFKRDYKNTPKNRKEENKENKKILLISLVFTDNEERRTERQQKNQESEERKNTKETRDINFRFVFCLFFFPGEKVNTGSVQSL